MRNLTKTKLLPLLVAGTMLSVLAACGGGGGGDPEPGASESAAGPVPEPTAPVTITFSSWVGNDKGMKTLYKKFQAEHPNITIEFQDVPAEESEKKLTTQIAGGNPPDAAYVDASNMADFAPRKALVDLDELHQPQRRREARRLRRGLQDLVTVRGQDVRAAVRRRVDRPVLPHRPVRGGRHRRARRRPGRSSRPTPQKLTDPAKKQYGFAGLRARGGVLLVPLAVPGRRRPAERRTRRRSCSTATRASRRPSSTSAWPSTRRRTTSTPTPTTAGWRSPRARSAMYMAGAWFAGTLSDEFPKIDGKWATAPLPDGTAGCKTTIAGDALVHVRQGREAGRRLEVDRVPVPAGEHGRVDLRVRRARCCRR